MHEVVTIFFPNISSLEEGRIQYNEGTTQRNPTAMVI